MSPLEILQGNLARYTPLRVKGTHGVMDLMTDGVARLGDIDGPAFADYLTRGLDVRSDDVVPINRHCTERARWMGATALDKSEPAHVRLGSMITLATMHFVHDSRTVLRAPWTNRRTVQSIGTIGNVMLTQIRDNTWEQDALGMHALASELLRQPPVDPESVAIDIADMPERVLHVLSADDTPEVPYEDADQDASSVQLIGSPNVVPVADMSITRGTLAKMNWVHMSGGQELCVYPIATDGKVIAYMADLTSLHPTLQEYAEELAAHPRLHQQFCNRLARTIVRAYTGLARPKRVRAQKVPTYYVSNPGADNGDVTRGYFATIGKYGDVPLVGLIAAVRSKGRQQKVLGIITNQPMERIRNVN